MKSFNIFNEAKFAFKLVGTSFAILLSIIMLVIIADNSSRINGLEKKVYGKNEFKLQKMEIKKMSPRLSKQIQKTKKQGEK